MATAPQAAMGMPQQGENPYNDPKTLAVYDQMRKTVSPKQFGDEMLAGAEQVDPQEVAKFRSTLQQIQLPPEALDLLNNMVDEILASPQNYAEIRAKYKEMGAPDEILPEQFDAHFFAALNMAIDQMIAAPSGEQAFAKGGIAELTPVSKAISSYGRNGDTMLAHITPAEARMLRRKGGSGTINPKTGLPEFFNLFKEIGNAFKAVGNAVKSFVNSTVGRIVTTVALGFFLGPAAASFLGATSTAAVAAVSGFVGSAGATMLGGGNLKDSLKAGAMGALTAGAGAGIMGGTDAFTAGSYAGPTTISGQVDKFTNAISGTPAQAAPDVLRDNVTTNTAREAYISDLAKTNPELFKTPQTMAPATAPMQAPAAAPLSVPSADAFAPTATQFGAFGESPLANTAIGNASATTAATGNAVAPSIGAPAPVMPSAATGNAIAPAIGNPMDATQFEGSLAKVSGPTTADGSLWDKTKDFWNKNISPSGIQQQGMPAAQDAAAKAVTDLTARIPDASAAMKEAAYQNAYKAAMPGFLSTYGPATAVGIGAIGAFGGFSPSKVPVSPYQDMLTGGPGSARDLLSKNPTRYHVQNLPGVTYYNGSVIKPTGLAEGGDVSSNKVRHFAFGGGDFGRYFFENDGGSGDQLPIDMPIDMPYDPYTDMGPSQPNPNVGSPDPTRSVVLPPEGVPEEIVITAQGPTYPPVTIDPIDVPPMEMPELPELPPERPPERFPERPSTIGPVDPAEIPIIEPQPIPIELPVDRFPERPSTIGPVNPAEIPIIEPQPIPFELPVEPPPEYPVEPPIEYPVEPPIEYPVEPPIEWPVTPVQPPIEWPVTPVQPPTPVDPPVAPPVAPPAPVQPTNPVATPPVYAAQPVPRAPQLVGNPAAFNRPGVSFGSGTLPMGMSQYGSGITGLMSQMGAPAQSGGFSMPVVPNATPASQNLPQLPQDLTTQQQLAAAQARAQQKYEFAMNDKKAAFMNMGGIAGLAQGGYPRRTGQISGPGTETSDSIPAMLSDGEFVMTAKAVRAAGKGDRRAGAKRMYALMHQLERNASRG